jgi:small subunit ribosomal protein S21
VRRHFCRRFGREAFIRAIKIVVHPCYKIQGRKERFLEVTVYQNQVEKALKVLKRQMTKEGLLKELKRRRFYEKPSVKKKRKQKEAKKKRKAALRRMRSYNRL